MTKQDIQDYKDNRNLEKGFNAYWNKGFDEAIDLLKNNERAINVIQCSTQLPDELEPVLAKIEHINDLGKSSWYEVVFNDGNWRSYQGSKTFEDGEKVVKWKYCKAIV